MIFCLQNPIEIFQVWKGGMAFHGGMIGVIFSTYIFCLKKNLNFFLFSDFLACSAPIGIFLGRIANFINGELVGRITEKKIGVIFPHIDNFKRHPSQIYEAFFEGILLFYILFYFQKKGILTNKSGYTNDEAVKVVLENTEDIYDRYIKDGKEHYSKTGSYINGSYIEDDLSICKKLNETIF